MRFPASERSHLIFFSMVRRDKQIRTFSDFDYIYSLDGSSQGCLEYAFTCLLFFSTIHLCTINKHLAVGVSVDMSMEVGNHWSRAHQLLVVRADSESSR